MIRINARDMMISDDEEEEEGGTEGSVPAPRRKTKGALAAQRALDDERHALVLAGIQALTSLARTALSTPGTAQYVPRTVAMAARTTVIHEEIRRACSRSSVAQRGVQVMEFIHTALCRSRPVAVGTSLEQVVVRSARRPCPWPAAAAPLAGTGPTSWLALVEAMQATLAVVVSGLAVLRGVGSSSSPSSPSPTDLAKEGAPDYSIVVVLGQWLVEEAEVGLALLWEVEAPVSKALNLQPPTVFCSRDLVPEAAHTLAGWHYLGYALVDHAMVEAASITRNLW